MREEVAVDCLVYFWGPLPLHIDGSGTLRFIGAEKLSLLRLRLGTLSSCSRTLSRECRGFAALLCYLSMHSRWWQVVDARAWGEGEETVVPPIRYPQGVITPGGMWVPTYAKSSSLETVWRLGKWSVEPCREEATRSSETDTTSMPWNVTLEC
ncbi:hypothetical protein BC827DRAFT_1157304 [Russula dissimulans]|nr:hypothetical protein BC827DRAFT_1157304 [Russula dissimulans]